MLLYKSRQDSLIGANLGEIVTLDGLCGGGGISTAALNEASGRLHANQPLLAALRQNRHNSYVKNRHELSLRLESRQG